MKPSSQPKKPHLKLFTCGCRVPSLARGWWKAQEPEGREGGTHIELEEPRIGVAGFLEVGAQVSANLKGEPDGIQGLKKP